MPTKAELEQQLRDTTDKYAEVSEKLQFVIDKHDPIRHRDETRSVIALFVVKTFFYLLAIVLIGVPIYNQVAYPEIRLSVVDVITVLAGVISGPFGFVVGYYFKGSEND